MKKSLVFLAALAAASVSWALDGVPVNGVQWYINPSTGSIVGYRNPVTQQDTSTLGAIGFGALTATTITGTVLRATTSSSPLSNAGCSAGTIYWDANYIYVCTASGTVKRAALTGGY
jgi:hypothetical protein